MISRTAFALALVLLMFGDIASQTPQYKLGVAYASSLYSNKESFEFSTGDNQKIVLDSAHPTPDFTRRFSSGERYTVIQTSGPRQCTFNDPATGTFGNADIRITVNCGLPALTNMKLQVSGIASGETFSFADNYGRRYSYPFSVTANLGSYPQGDDYQITQTQGPRPCKFTLNQGVVPTTPITIGADCGASPAPPRSFPAVELVSRSTDDKSFSTFYSSSAPVIGGKGADEGRYVAFVSSAVGLGGSTGKHRQILWRDRVTGETRMISSTTAGEGNGDSFAPAISSDGRSVAFESYATNLVPIDTNGVRDVFVWNLDANTITAVSDAPGDVEANAEAFEPAISGDGKLIAFTSSASTLTPGVDGTSTVNVFLKDMRSGAVTLISRHPKTGKGAGGSRPSISGDGSRIALYSYSPLTDDDKNSLWDLFLWQNGDPKLKRIKTAEAAERDQGTESASRVVAPAISGDGRYVTFSTTATNVVSGDTNKVQDAFVTEIDSGRVIRLSLGKDRQQPDADTPIDQGERISISYDGSWVAFSSNAKNLGGNVILKNVRTGETKVVSASSGASAGRPDISHNGMYVVFGTSEKLDSRFPSSGIFVKNVGTPN